jgi:hypothetical protein
MLGGYVEALAMVYHRFVDAKQRIERHEDFRSYLLQIGEVDAAEACTSHIKELERDLAELEAALLAMMARVSRAFDAIAANRPCEPPRQAPASYRETIGY